MAHGFVFDGCDWDLEGNDDASQNLSEGMVALVADFCREAKEHGYLIALAPAESYLDAGSPRSTCVKSRAARAVAAGRERLSRGGLSLRRAQRLRRGPGPGRHGQRRRRLGAALRGLLVGLLRADARRRRAGKRTRRRGRRRPIHEA